MENKPRMIENYEVKEAIHIGGREVILAEDLSADKPYMVCDCPWNDYYQADKPENMAVTTDYLSAMEDFTGRVSAEVQKIRDERAEHGISGEPLTAADCVPGSEGADLKHQLIVIKPERREPYARTADRQLYYVTGGSGCDPASSRPLLACTSLYTGERADIIRSAVAGIVLPERVPEWARERMREMDLTYRAPAIPKVYMASFEEARQQDQLSECRESRKLNEACASDMTDAIQSSHDGKHSYRLGDAYKAVAEQYGAERVHMVLANTLDIKSYDGRFSRENKAWAQQIQIPRLAKEHRASFVCEAHPAILDGFIYHARKQQMEKKPSVVEQLKTPARKSASKKKDKPRDNGAR